ncbi:DUF2130 domain-containing protein [Spiroplasma platyhelix]|uniref:DUF2130 domain-containing protein n=1 Tax=Spiroplasma platyhelix PALS-1 TaxID=1276218 RepID=A0A846TZQ3_9MOLU|nr:DUF2130 domain-containing protein [Spiroplasma platyhelix]MBE4703881.1 hypothetical protein [Spiroplasma platyhelix PALS-1]NKE38254.1 DUF2130 domain-containing protein [Spiroplasma platyhelix PALS-1]UJB29139.1 hypothetical protein SPLAT_v1c03750 [Spiroplasma platyhelix PALS-1]
MSFEFKCPNCNHLITEKDFNNNEKIMSHLNEIFKKHETEYINQLRAKLSDRYKAELMRELKRTAAEKEIEVSRIYQTKLDQLNQVIASQKVAVSKSESELAKALLEKENELIKINQKELDKLNEIIAEQKNRIENTNIEIDRALAQHEVKLNKQSHDEITALRTQISRLEKDKEAQKLMLEKLLVDKENELIKLNHEQLDQLKQVIAEQKNKIETSSVELEKTLAQHEVKLTNQKHEEITTLKAQINELREANLQFKVIQNKTKGENFEHEVESELRKVFEPDDIISKITAQDKKADYLQEVRQDNSVIGKIVYEVKNAEWSNNWEKKLVEDMAKQNSKYGILIATSFNSKYQGIPFKRSDYNANVYLSDPESFYFVGQILRTLIKIEHRLESNRDKNDYNEKINQFNKWKETQLPKLDLDINNSLQEIDRLANLITGRAEDIKKEKGRIYKNWVKNVKDYLENFIF